MRKQNEPIRYESCNAFVDYANDKGEYKTIISPVFAVPDYCNELRKFRMDNQITLRTAAQYIGISAAELSGIEQGRYAATEEEVRRFMTILEGTLEARKQ
jgi:predicted transcriptional regulator